MTYDDFYKLLKIEPNQDLSKSMPPCNDQAESMPDVVPRRHSIIDVNLLDSPVVSKVKTYRKLQSVILDASKYAIDDHATSGKRRKRPSLLFRRSAQEGELSLLCKSIDTLTVGGLPFE